MRIIKNNIKMIGIVLLSLSILFTSINENFIVNASMNENSEVTTGGSQRIDANNLVWTKSTDQDILGGADDFNGIFFEHFSNFNETGGPVASPIINNVGIITFAENSQWGINQFIDYKMPKFNVSVLTNELLKQPNQNALQVFNGDVVAANELDLDLVAFHSTNYVHIRPKSVGQFFIDSKKDLINQNKKIWDIPSTFELDSEIVKRDKSINIELSQGVNVVKISENMINQEVGVNINLANGVSADDIDLLVFNVDSKLVDIGDTFINGSQVHANLKEMQNILNKTIWNLNPNLNSLIVNKSKINGTLLAPNSNVKFTNGYSAINGTIIANSLDTDKKSYNSELHYIGNFLGKLTLPKTINVKVNKTWLGKVEDAVTVQLLADGNVQEEVELSEQNHWSHEFRNLKEKNEEGQVINYNIRELDAEKYENVEIEQVDNTFTITNTNFKKTSVNIEKVWNGQKGDQVEIELYKDSQKIETVVLNDSKGWKYVFKNLDMYNKDGSKIKYSVKEVNGHLYDVKIEEESENSFIITNTNPNQEVKDIKVKKEWIGQKGDQVEIELYKNSQKFEAVILDDSNGWKHVFENLDIHNADGSKNKYTVKEVNGHLYDVKIEEESENSFIITNTNTNTNPNQEVKNINVTKEWNGKSEKSVEIELLSGSKTIDKVTLNDTNKWTYTFENLDKYSSDGQLIEYRVREVNGKQFDAVIEEYQPNKFKITNTNLGETTVNVKKTWVGKAENEVEINLLANGIIKESILLNNENSWKYTFEGLDQYDSNGKEISYRVEEIGGDKYNAEIKELDKNNYEITNYNQGSRSIKIDKIWDGKALDSVEIDLVADGKWLDTFTLNDDNHWSLEVNNLPIYDEDGNFIEYTIVEKYYENYTSTLSGDVENGFVITNKEIVPVDPVKPEIEDPKEVSPGSKDPDTPNDEGVLGVGREPKLPSTGMGISANIYLGGLLTIIGLVIKRKNKH